MINSKHVFKIGDTIKTNKGKETMLEYMGEGEINRKRKVKVKCKCGKEWEVQLGNVLNGSTSSCGKSPCRSIKYGPKDSEVGYKALLYVYKKHAKERGFEFHLTYDEFKHMLQQNCHYCNSEPKQVYQLFKPGTKIVRTGVPVIYNGIDRMDSSGHYTKENTVTACKRCNVGKMDQSYNEFIQQVINIYNNLNLKQWEAH